MPDKYLLAKQMVIERYIVNIQIQHNKHLTQDQNYLFLFRVTDDLIWN